MSTHHVSELRNKHVGKDIYVIGSGPSLTFVNNKFFHNKIVVCVNHTIVHLDKADSLYLVAKEPTKSMQAAAVRRNAKIVTCRHHSGVPTNPLNEFFYPESTYLFDPKADVISRKGRVNALERSSSTIVTGLHLAAFLGTKYIILVGHDCGRVDDEMHVENYNKRGAVMKGGAYVKWMKHNKVEAKTLKAKAQLKQYWGVEVYSLNPFVNFGLEGHKYERF
jgi:hypothetical protein